MIHPPVQWDPGWPLVVTCSRNLMGGTDVAASFLGVSLHLITFDEYDVDAQGIDGIRSRIQSLAGDLIADALRVVA